MNLIRRPVPEFEVAAKQRLRDFYDTNAKRRQHYRRQGWYYHHQLTRYLREIIPEGARVLDIGCGDGEILAALKPSRGVGIDFSAGMIAEALAKHPHLEFVDADAEYVTYDETFDYIVLCDCISNVLDIQRVLENCRSACSPSTRIVVCYHSMLWEPILKCFEAMRIKMPQPHHNWLSDSDIFNFLTLTGLDLVKYDRLMLSPVYVPMLSTLLNRYAAPLPLVNNLCLTHMLVMRLPAPEQKPLSTTILIPTRNERGNIRDAVARLPAFGSHQEIMFVDGHSTDGTADEIRAVIAENPGRDIKYFEQPGRGKADAVRYGFARATGDILMILDADLTVPPENLVRCYEAIVENRGELLIGSRLVYPMEKEAMRFLNIIGNRLFSLLFSWLLNQKIKDTLCGTKVLLRTNYAKVQKAYAFFGDFDPFGDFELIFGAARQNLKIVEIPFRYRERTYGSTNISRFRHGWVLLQMCLFALRRIKMR